MVEGSESSAAQPVRPGWARYVVPSVADLVFVSMVGLLVFTPLSTRLLGDAGIGWHIRTGQQILATRAVPRVDSFSSVMRGQPWFAWEWLYDIVVGWLESAAGLNAVVLLTAVVIALTFAGTFRLIVRRGTNVLLAVALVLLAASASMIHFFARPHVLSWLLTLVWYWVLESSEQESMQQEFLGAEKRSARWLWWLPPLMLLWVNVHGGFLLGFVLLGIYGAAAIWRWFALREDKFGEFLLNLKAARRARDLALVAVASAAATLANPYGIKLHVHIYRYLSNRFLIDHIEEFQSPNFHGVAQRCFAILLLLTLVALAARGRQMRMSEVLLVLFAVYAGLYASRNIPIASILLVLAIAPHLSVAVQKVMPGNFAERMGGVERSLRGYLWPVGMLAFTCWIVAHGGTVGSRSLATAQFGEKRFPMRAVDFLEKRGVPGPVMSPDYWGGYLIYRFYPRVLVVVDDRHDLYGEEFFKAYLKMVRAEPGWDELLKRYSPGCVLAPKDSPLASLLLQSRDWRAIYSDDVAKIFVRN